MCPGRGDLSFAPASPSAAVEAQANLIQAATFTLDWALEACADEHTTRYAQSNPLRFIVLLSWAAIHSFIQRETTTTTTAEEEDTSTG